MFRILSKSVYTSTEIRVSMSITSWAESISLYRAWSNNIRQVLMWLLQYILCKLKVWERKYWLQDDIYHWVKSNVSNCPRQLFIFDEVDKIPDGVLNHLKPLLDYTTTVEKVDYRQAIFIFLSNTGSSLITENILNLYDNGYRRENIRLSDFENLIAQGAFNEFGM